MELCLEKTLLKSLPDEFEFKGTLNLNNSDIEVLPKKLYIEEDLVLTNSKIKKVELPLLLFI